MIEDSKVFFVGRLDGGIISEVNIFFMLYDIFNIIIIIKEGVGGSAIENTVTIGSCECSRAKESIGLITAVNNLSFSDLSCGFQGVSGSFGVGFILGSFGNELLCGFKGGSGLLFIG
jgi:hypothetical protein